MTKVGAPSTDTLICHQCALQSLSPSQCIHKTSDSTLPWRYNGRNRLRELFEEVQLEREESTFDPIDDHHLESIDISNTLTSTSLPISQINHVPIDTELQEYEDDNADPSGNTHRTHTNS